MSIINYHTEMDQQSDRYAINPSIADYEPNPETVRIYDFIYNLHSAMRSIGAVHGRVDIDYKQYIVDILTPECRALVLHLLNSAPPAD